MVTQSRIAPKRRSSLSCKCKLRFLVIADTDQSSQTQQTVPPWEVSSLDFSTIDVLREWRWRDGVVGIEEIPTGPGGELNLQPLPGTSVSDLDALMDISNTTSHPFADGGVSPVDAPCLTTSPSRYGRTDCI